MFDLSVVLSGAALVLAIASPIITAVLNNRYNLKIHRSNLIDTRRLDVIENYLKYATMCSYNEGVPEEFSLYKSLIFLYAPTYLQEKIIKLNSIIENTRFSKDAAALLKDIAIGLRKENEVSYKNPKR